MALTIAGTTVNIGARVVALAAAGEVLVSRTVTDLVVGSGTGAGSRVTGYTGIALAASPGTPAAAFDFDAVPGFAGGVFVG